MNYGLKKIINDLVYHTIIISAEKLQEEYRWSDEMENLERKLIRICNVMCNKIKSLTKENKELKENIKHLEVELKSAENYIEHLINN
jgi:mRNA-degrading endonuclease toxin of MazEF toxin-antitoxin module